MVTKDKITILAMVTLEAQHFKTSLYLHVQLVYAIASHTYKLQLYQARNLVAQFYPPTQIFF